MELPKFYSDLNPQQRRKCAHFLGMFNEEKSVELTLLVGGTGVNGYKPVCQKLYLLINDKPEAQRYDDALYAQFALKAPVTLGNIMSIVSKVRRELGLPPYITSLDRECLEDFLKLFIVDIETTKVAYTNKKGEAKERIVRVSYTPTFRLKPLQANE